MKPFLWPLLHVVSVVVAIAVAALVGSTLSMVVCMPDAPQELVDAHRTDAPPAPATGRPIVAVVLGNTQSEVTDVLGPFAIFAESGAYDVMTVAESRALRTLTGGLEVVPHRSFQELDALVPGGPAIVVVPAMLGADAEVNAPVRAWLRERARGGAMLFSWCAGAEVLAASGVVDGRAVTTHWGDIGRLESAYPAVRWTRGTRYLESDRLLTTGGLTAGIDATLHLLAQRDGTEVATRVAHSLGIPASSFVASPRTTQYDFAPADAIFVLNGAFRWPKRHTGLWLHDGVGEFGLAAVLDVYAASFTDTVLTVGRRPSVTSRHGLTLVPRARANRLPALERVFVVDDPEGESDAGAEVRAALGDAAIPIRRLHPPGASRYPYRAALEAIARDEGRATAAFAAKRLEYRGSPIGAARSGYDLSLALIPLLAAGLSVFVVHRVRVRRARRASAGQGSNPVEAR